MSFIPKIVSFFSNFSIFKETNVFETLIVFDGVFNAMKFAKEYLIYTLDRDTTPGNDQNDRKESFIKRCHRLYRLGYVDRYILYTLIWASYSGLDFVTEALGAEFRNAIYVSMCLFTVPYIQNTILYSPVFRGVVDDFVETKGIFIKYTLSKTIVRFIDDLDPGVIDIQNYQIFVLYNCLSLELLYTFLKNYSFVAFLANLRKAESTYYYYKAIKLSYYYNTGFLFNIVTRKDAICIVNDIVKRKEWKSLIKIENTNVLYTLFSQRATGFENWRDVYIYSLRGFSVWSSICLLKLLNFWIMTGVIGAYILTQCFIYDWVFVRSRLVSTMFFYFAVSLNINDLIISLFFVKFDLLYNFSHELYFFIRNRHNIKKVLVYYQRQ